MRLDESTSPKPDLGQARSNARDLEKLANIAEIVELLEDTQQDNKEWLIKQVKENRLKIHVHNGMNTILILKSCPPEFLTNLLTLLRSKKSNDEFLTPLSKTYHWFFTDIVSSSDPRITTKEQLRKIIELNKMIKRTDVFGREKPDSMMIIPTGDGVAIGFEHHPEKPLILAFQLHDEINRHNQDKVSEDEKIYTKTGLDTGAVFFLEDLRGKQNVWGPGIITARRVMDLAKSMNILSSANIANAIRDLKPEYRDYFHPVGDYPIKHGENITIYNIYDDIRGNSKFPEPGSIDEKTVFFNRIDVTLEVKDSKTMLTHHSWLWEIVNISKKPIQDVFYFLEGDVPKSFEDLNIKITDESNNILTIPTLETNNPYKKEFYVKMNKPILSYKTATIKIEYDWEEPKRQYFYEIIAECREFRFRLTVPKDLPIAYKIFQVNEFKLGTFPKTGPSIPNFFDDKTELTWSAQDLRAGETYRFSW